MRIRRRPISLLLAAVAGALLVPACTSSSASGGSSSPITLALVTSLTGTAAPEFSTAPAGFNARIDLQNAEGGVDGHKLVPLVIDDQSSPAADVSGVPHAL